MAKNVNLTASALVKTGYGKALGVFCSSSTAGTVKLWNNTAGSGTVLVNTFSVAAGTFYSFGTDGLDFTTGLFCTIGGTTDIVVVFE